MLFTDLEYRLLIRLREAEAVASYAYADRLSYENDALRAEIARKQALVTQLKKARLAGRALSSVR